MPRLLVLSGDELLPGMDNEGNPVAIPADLLRSASIGYAFPTWVNLAEVEGSVAGQRGEVPALDSGTHTDPVVGGTVPNAGVFSWSESPPGWKRISDPVTTSSSIPLAGGAWETDKTYLQNTITSSAGSSYMAIETHVSDAASEPEVGVDWEDHWVLVAEKGDKGDKGDPNPLSINWSSGVAILENTIAAEAGSSYIAIQDHTSSSASRPGVGVDWEDYWVRVAAKGDQGVRGNLILYGTTVPGSGLGLDGDQYFRYNTNDVYEKVAGAWVLRTNLTGPQGPATIAAYDIIMSFMGGPPTSSQLLYYAVPRLEVTFAADFGGSVASIGTNPTASFAINVYDASSPSDAGTLIGTVTFNTSGAPTFTTVGGTEKVVAAGRCIKFIAPASVDATAANIAITLAGDSTADTLSLGTLSAQDADDVLILGGQIEGVTLTDLPTPIALEDGGTGVDTLEDLKTLLGLVATGFPKRRVITANGAGTYTPTVGTKRIRVTGVAAGARGGYATASGSNSGVGAGGGGSGAWGTLEIDLTAGGGIASIPYSIGSGTVVEDGNGGNTTFGSSGVYLNLEGGKAGSNRSASGSAAAAGGAGGTVLTGTGTGTGVIADTLQACAGQPGNGGGGVEVYGDRWGLGGNGGSTPWGSGGRGQNNAVGLAATGPGGGGAGGSSHSGGGKRDGGNGFRGLIIIEEFAE